MRRRSMGLLALLFCSGAALAAIPESQNPIVDLHAHIFFYEGAGIRWFGTFDTPVAAREWSDRIETKINAGALERSGVSIAVAALYAHPLFLYTERESVRRQIRAAEQFVATHPDWIVARGPSDARQAIARGKRALVLSIEGISGIIESDEDIREFVDEDGVRIVTLEHFTDDEFGGAAFMPGIEILADPWAAIQSLLWPQHDMAGVRVNPQGLKPKGREIIEKLVQRGVWIDLAHSSDMTQRGVMPILEQWRQPLLYTHTVMRGAMRGERGISPLQLEQVRKSGGIAGILPSDDMLRGTITDPRYCPAVCRSRCHGGLADFLTQYSQAVQALGPGSVMIGSDIDAPLTFLRPSCAAQANLSPQGFWNYTQIMNLWQAIEDAKLAPAGRGASWMVDRFLETWSRLEPELRNPEQ